MKNYLHNYKGYGIHPSTCRIHIKEMGTSTWIGFENLGEGTSVTNASEQLASEIIDKENLNPNMCKFFEWYPEYEGRVDEVSYHWRGLNASFPDWKHYCDSDKNPFLNNI